MKRTKPFGVGIGPKMSSALAMMVVLGVVTGLTLPATAANIPWPPTVAKEDSNRDKSGTSAVRIEQVPSQAPENKTVMTGDAFQAERGRFELPRPFRADRFSKPAHSAALPPLQDTSLPPAKPWFPSAFPGVPRDVTASDFTSPDCTELRGNSPPSDKSGDKRFCAAFPSVPVAAAACRVGADRSGNTFMRRCQVPRV